jgi:hypothetical protein
VVVRDTRDGWCIDVLRDNGTGPAPIEAVLTGPMGGETPDAR